MLPAPRLRGNLKPLRRFSFALGVLFLAGALGAQTQKEIDDCWNAFDGTAKIPDAEVEKERQRLDALARELRERAETLRKSCSGDEAAVRLHRLWSGEGAAAPAVYNEVELTRTNGRLPGGGPLSYAADVAAPLQAAAARCGCEAKAVQGTDPGGRAYTVTRIVCPLDCGCESEPGYDRDRYERRIACLTGEIEAVDKERADLARRQGGNPRVGAYLRRSSAWETLFGVGVKVDAKAFVPGTSPEVAPLDATDFLKDISRALVQGGKSVDAEIQAAVTKHSRGQGQARLAFEQLGNRLKAAYRAKLAELGWSAEEIEVLMSGSLSPDDQKILNGIEELRARSSYFEARRKILERALIDLREQRCKCIDRFVQSCLRPQWQAAEVMSELYRNYLSARDKPGQKDRFTAKLKPDAPDCKVAREIVAHPERHPAGLVAFARCYLLHECPERRKAREPDDQDARPGTLRREDRLAVATFETPEGKIHVYLPGDLRPGDTLSGVVVAEPAGRSEDERAANLSTLSGLVVELGTDRRPVGEGIASGRVEAEGPLRLVLRDSGGNAAGRVDLPPATSAPPEAPGSGIEPPPVGQTGRPIRIEGPFDGDLGTTRVTVGDQPAEVLAESPRGTIVRAPVEVVGPVQIRVEEGGSTARAPYRNVAIHLSAPRTSLRRGERTVMTVAVSGLQGLDRPLEIRIENRSSGVVGLEGGDSQTITIQPREVTGAGIFTLERRLTGRSAGAFDISARLVP